MNGIEILRQGISRRYMLSQFQFSQCLLVSPRHSSKGSGLVRVAASRSPHLQYGERDSVYFLYLQPLS